MIELEGVSPRRFGPPAHDQRGKHRVVGSLAAPRGLGAVEEFLSLGLGFTRSLEIRLGRAQRRQRRLSVRIQSRDLPIDPITRAQTPMTHQARR